MIILGLWIIFSIILNILFLIILLILMIVFVRKIIYEKGVLYSQICDVKNRLDHIGNILIAHVNDLALSIDENNVKIMEKNELIKQEIIDNISEFKIYAENNYIISEKEKLVKFQELKENLHKVYKSNEAIQQNISTMEEIFRLQLINGLLNDVDKVITDYQK